ncbi:MAG: hypothetical protein ACR2LK_15315 [Solirubrobacteraceae bacterium]
MTAERLPAAAARHAAPMLLAATGALFGIRAVLALTRSGPILFADEAGYLGAARMLAGGMDFAMGSSPFYRPGYALVLVPVARLEIDPATMYAVVVVVNAMLAASLVGLLYLLLRRCFDQPPAPALGGAIVGAVYPTVSSITQIAKSENLLFPLIVAWLLAFGMLLRARGRRGVVAGLAFGACGAALWTVHGRMIVALSVTFVALVALAGMRRIGAAAAAAGLVASSAGFVLARILDARVIAHNYEGRDVDEVGSALAAIDGLGAVASVLRNLAGETWYLLVASFGILGVVVVAAGARTAVRLRRREAQSADLSLALLLATTAGLLVLSAVWFADPTRPDHLIYGRYVEPVVPPLLALGVSMLATRSLVVPIGRVLAAIALLTVVVAGLRSGLRFEGEDANRWSIASMPFVTSDLQPAVLAGAGVVAAAGTWVLARVSRRAPAALWLVMLALFVPVTAYTEVRLILRAERAVYPAGWVSPQPVVEARGAAVAFDTSHFDNIAVKVYQWFLPHSRFETFDGASSRAPSPLVFSGATWPKEHPERPATAVWRDPGRDEFLWELGPER